MLLFKRYILPGVLLMLLLLFNACNSEKGQEEQLGNSDELHIAVAAGLRFALEEISQAFEAENDIKIVFQFGSSGNLAQQISSGAPIDLFLSSNQNFIEGLVAGGDILEESIAHFAMGRIVLAVNKQADLDIQVLEDLLDEDIIYISIANPSHAPYGMAAKEVLEKMGLWHKLEKKLVYGETITQAMQYIQTGNAPAGIIALSSAVVPEIDYFLIDNSLHSPLIHTLGIVSRSERQELASEFVAFINSPRGKAIMEEYGFCQPDQGGDAP